MKPGQGFYAIVGGIGWETSPSPAHAPRRGSFYAIVGGIGWETVSLWVLSLVALGLLLAGQPATPRPWFDEDLNTTTAATFARTGLYALPDATGPRLFDPAIQTGPTVLVPIAVVYKLFGVGFLQARLVIVGFAIMALALYWRLANRLVGSRAALLALALLLAGTPEPLASFVSVGRQVLGEVPALAYLLLGFLIWLQALESEHSRFTPLVFSGLAWGIAMLTKSQVLLTLPVALASLALLDWLYYRQTGWRAFLVPGAVAIACVGAWYAAQMAIAGPELFARNATVLREGARLHLLGIEPAHWRNAAGSIWRTGFWIWGPPALVWGALAARQRSLAGIHHAVILVFALTMTIWFAVLSIGWERYLFFPIVLAPIWLAGMLLQLTSAWRPTTGVLASVASAGLVAALLIGNFTPQIHHLAEGTSSGYAGINAYLGSEVPHDALIETWEWELSLTAPQPMHHPPTEITNAYTAHVISQGPRPENLYDPLHANPDYILIGPFSRLTSLYTQAVERYGEKTAAFGEYVLYRIRK